MTKCDFCAKSLPNGECYLTHQSIRESYCEKAIKKMITVFKNTNKENILK